MAAEKERERAEKEREKQERDREKAERDQAKEREKAEKEKAKEKERAEKAAREAKERELREKEKDKEKASGGDGWSTLSWLSLVHSKPSLAESILFGSSKKETLKKPIPKAGGRIVISDPSNFTHVQCTPALYLPSSIDAAPSAQP